MKQGDAEGDYKVVMNQEGQYSIWPIGKKNPLGWEDAGPDGTSDECLAHIKELWSDMRPRSLRESPQQLPNQFRQ